MEASSPPVVTDEQKEEAARRFCERATAFMESLEECSRLGVDIVSELDKLGVELPPFAATLFGG